MLVFISLVEIVRLNDVFEQISNVVRKDNISLEIKKGVMKCYAIYVFPYDRECGKIDSQMENTLKAKEI